METALNEFFSLRLRPSEIFSEQCLLKKPSELRDLSTALKQSRVIVNRMNGLRKYAQNEIFNCWVIDLGIEKYRNIQVWCANLVSWIGQIKNQKGSISNLNPDTVYSFSISMKSTMICDSIIRSSILYSSKKRTILSCILGQDSELFKIIATLSFCRMKKKYRKNVWFKGSPGYQWFMKG